MTRTLSQKAALNKLAQVGLSLELIKGHVWAKFQLPTKASNMTALARLLAELYESNEIFLLFGDWDVWPTSTYLVESVRRGLGAKRNLAQQPAHTFYGSDAEDQLEAGIALALFYSWSAVVVGGPADPVLAISHDEYITVVHGYGKPQKAVAVLRAFGLTEMRRPAPHSE